MGASKDNLSVDVAKAYATNVAESAQSGRARFTFLLGNSEVHCVAAYRFGQYSAELKERHRFLGAVAQTTHRIWNRKVTHLDHCEISGAASIGPGMLLMHRHGIILGPVELGSNCVIHQNVTIGQRVAAGDQGVPRIGNDVWIGPGAVITGAITIGDGVTISAGTILSRDVPAHCLVGGNPGRVIAHDYDNRSILNYSVES